MKGNTTALKEKQRVAPAKMAVAQGSVALVDSERDVRTVSKVKPALVASAEPYGTRPTELKMRTRPQARGDQNANQATADVSLSCHES